MGTLKYAGNGCDRNFPVPESTDAKLSADILSRPADSRLPAPPGKGIEIDGLFISRKRNRHDFVLVRLLDAAAYSVIHYIAVEGQVLQMEVLYLHNAYEREQLQKRRKLCAAGLFVDLEPVSAREYRRYERVARRYLATVLTAKR